MQHSPMLVVAAQDANDVFHVVLLLINESEWTVDWIDTILESKNAPDYVSAFMMSLDMDVGSSMPVIFEKASSRVDACHCSLIFSVVP